MDKKAKKAIETGKKTPRYEWSYGGGGIQSIIRK